MLPPSTTRRGSSCTWRCSKWRRRTRTADCKTSSAPPSPPTHPHAPVPPAPAPSLPRPARSGPQRGRAARQIRAGIFVRVVLRLPGRRVRGVDAPSPAAAAAAGASAVWPEHTNRRLLTPRGCRLPVQSPRRLAAAVQLIAALAARVTRGWLSCTLALGRGVAVSLVRRSVVAPHRLGRFSPLSSLQTPTVLPAVHWEPAYHDHQHVVGRFPAKMNAYHGW